MGCWDGSAATGTCWQTWWSMLDLRDSHGERREPIPESYPLTSTSMPWVVYSPPHTYTRTHARTYAFKVSKNRQKGLTWIYNECLLFSITQICKSIRQWVHWKKTQSMNFKVVYITFSVFNDCFCFSSFISWAFIIEKENPASVYVRFLKTIINFINTYGIIQLW